MRHIERFGWVAMIVALGISGTTTAAEARSKLKQSLTATAVAPEAGGKATFSMKNDDGKLTLTGKRLDHDSSYDVIIDGVKVGTLTTSGGGNGKARFRSRPRSSKDQLLGVNPIGKLLTIRSSAGEDVLVADLPLVPPSPGSEDDIRCCLPDDSGTECEDRTSAECAAQGGVDMGPGSCVPNPCAGGSPVDEADIVCCIPDNSGPECEDRTTAECAAAGGVVVLGASCVENPCAPTPPVDGDIQCCLPDDSGPECEDRTPEACLAAGGLNMGPGVCSPNPCPDLGGGGGGGGGTPVLVVTCERRSNRSRASVNGSNLASGNYTARITSGANSAAAPAAPTIGDQVEFDFDSDGGDIAAGATAIAPDFIQGSPAQVTGEIRDASNNVVASATANCLDR